MVGPSAASARMSSGVVAGPPPGVKEGRDGRSAGSGIPPSLPVLCPETECGQDQTVAVGKTLSPFPPGTLPLAGTPDATGPRGLALRVPSDPAARGLPVPPRIN